MRRGNDTGYCEECCWCLEGQFEFKSVWIVRSKCGTRHYCDGVSKGTFTTVTATLTLDDPCDERAYECDDTSYSFRPSWGAGGTAPIGTYTNSRNAETGECEQDFSGWTSVPTGPCQKYMVTLSGPISTASFVAETKAALPDIEEEEWEYGGPTAQTNLFDDENISSITESKWRYRVRISRSYSGRFFKLKWDEVKYETPGGIPTEVARVSKEATWDGVVPEGYDVGDMDTWPILGPFDYPAPDNNAYIQMENIRVFCRQYDVDNEVIE